MQAHSPRPRARFGTEGVCWLLWGPAAFTRRLVVGGSGGPGSRGRRVPLPAAGTERDARAPSPAPGPPPPDVSLLDSSSPAPRAHVPPGLCCLEIWLLAAWRLPQTIAVGPACERVALFPVRLNIPARSLELAAATEALSESLCSCTSVHGGCLAAQVAFFPLRRETVFGKLYLNLYFFTSKARGLQFSCILGFS